MHKLSRLCCIAGVLCLLGPLEAPATPSPGDIAPDIDIECPAWSPDGSRIAFHYSICPVAPSAGGHDDLFVVDVATGVVSPLLARPASDREPSWSPDGARIAFISDDGGSRQLWVMNADGSGAARLTNGAGTYEEPEWDRSGEHIVCAYSRGSGDGLNVVMVECPSGKRVKYWTSRGGAGSPALFQSQGQPDRLAYTQFVTDAGGHSLRLVLRKEGVSSLISGEAGTVDTDPCWSPDGTRVLVASNRDPGGGTGPSRLWTMDVSTEALTPLTSPPAGFRDGYPAWSQAASRVAFVRSNHTGTNIFTIKPDGTDLKQVTSYIW